MDPSAVLREVGVLVDAWCDRRCLRALRAILSGYPMASMLTDSWGELVRALEEVRAFARPELTEDEAASVDRLVGAASAIAFRA